MRKISHQQKIGRSGQSGALLFEILITISIIIFMSLISLPILRSYQPSISLHATARQLTTDLRSAQQLTITSQIPHAVVLDTSTNSKYDIVRNPVTPATIKTVTLDSSVSIQSVTGLTGGNSIVYNSYGAVSDSGTIILVNSQGQTATILVRPSGYVQIQ